MRRLPLSVCLMLALPLDSGAQSVRVEHRFPTDTLAHTYRLTLPADSVRGLVVLLSNWGNTFSEFDRQQVRLGQLLHPAGVAMMEISNTPWRTNYFADDSLAAIDSLIVGVMRAHRIPDGRVVIGGLQMAGTAALKYAQRCAERRCSAGTTPAGVFAVDPVLDLTRFWRAYDVYLRRQGGSRKGSREMVKGSLERELGGSLDIVPDRFERNSVYLHFDVNGGRALLLRGTAIRLYMEPDIQWYLRTWDDDYLSSNAADIAGLALFLRRHGNSRVELLTPTGRASLPDGRPSPHAWHLIEEAGLRDWILGLLVPAR